VPEALCHAGVIDTTQLH